MAVAATTQTNTNTSFTPSILPLSFILPPSFIFPSSILSPSFFSFLLTSSFILHRSAFIKGGGNHAGQRGRCGIERTSAATQILGREGGRRNVEERRTPATARVFGRARITHLPTAYAYKRLTHAFRSLIRLIRLTPYPLAPLPPCPLPLTPSSPSGLLLFFQTFSLFSLVACGVVCLYAYDYMYRERTSSQML